MRLPSIILATAASAAAATMVVAPPAQAQFFAYSLPASGKWRIQNIFDTDGGSAQVSKSKKHLTKLTLRVLDTRQSKCGKVVTLRKKLTIKRTGASKRPAVGRGKGTGIIKPIPASFTTDGKVVKGDALILWERNGKRALSAKVHFGDCNLNFALRK